MVRFGLRIPSITKRIAARTSIRRVVRHRLGVKAPRGFGWFTNPRKALYNRVYNRTTWGLFAIRVWPKRQRQEDAVADEDVSDDEYDEEGEIADEPGCFLQLLGLVILVVGVVLALYGCDSYVMSNRPRPAPAPAPPVLPVAIRRANDDIPPPAPAAAEPEVKQESSPIAEANRPAAVELQQDMESASPAELKASRIDAARWRTWKSENGKFSLHAKFVNVINGQMTLEKEDGSRTVVELDRLCEDDIKFVRRQEWKKAGKPSIR
jgi:uncharacterized cupin superfamily protein